MRLWVALFVAVFLATFCAQLYILSCGRAVDEGHTPPFANTNSGRVAPGQHHTNAREEERMWPALCPPVNKVHLVVILGGGVTLTGALPLWVSRRCDAAIHHAKALAIRDPKVRVEFVCSGGLSPHARAPIEHNGRVVHESDACATYLMERGEPASRIHREWTSSDTIGWQDNSCVYTHDCMVLMISIHVLFITNRHF
eukprot:m.17711 g.17711  ORF g.17711 m.17711 type:complete len:198 (-) comp7532_c0_seq2:632-1225(-)